MESNTDTNNTNITTVDGEDILCAVFPDSPGNCLALAYIRITVSILSTLGCFITMFLVWLLKRYQSFTQRMVLHLSVASLFLTLGYLMEGVYVQRGAVCQIQAFLLTFAQWAVLLWMLSITINLYLNVVWERSLEHSERWLCLGNWLFSAFLASLPFIDNVYGPAGVWCWIEYHWQWRFGIWYIAGFLSVIGIFIITIYTSVALTKKTRTTHSTKEKKSFEEDIRRLRAYPFAYLAVMLFPTINRFQNAISGENYVFALLLLQTIAGPLIGAVNAVVFGLDKSTFADIKALKTEGFSLAVKGRLGRKQRGGTIKEYPELPPSPTTAALNNGFDDISLS